MHIDIDRHNEKMIDPLQTEFKFDGKTFENNKNGIRKLLQLAYQNGLNSFNLNGSVYKPLMRKLKNSQRPTVIGDGEMKKYILRHITELNTHCVITRVNMGFNYMAVDIKNLSPLEFKKLRQDRYEAALKAKQEREEANRKAFEAQQAMDAEKAQIKKEIDNTYTGKWLNKNFSSVQKQEVIKKFINKVYNKEITIEFLNAVTPDDLVPINKKTDKDFVRIKGILAKDIVKQHNQLGNYWRNEDPLVNKINFFHTLQAATLMNSKITDEAKRNRRHDAAEQMGCLWLAKAFTE